MSRPLVQTVNLTKQFALRRSRVTRLLGRPEQVVSAADNVSLTIHEGETLGLVGESGSGKSTLARLILRLMSPTAGRILFDGQDITDLRDRQLRPVRRQMQMVFQDPYASLTPRQSVHDILSLPLRLHFHTTAAERDGRIRELFTQVGLSPEHAHRYPHQLSGGMRQRVCIARALAVQPAFIVLDEPVSALDVSIQAQILVLLQQLRQQFGLTYLFISHDLGVVRHLADRIAVTQQGKLVELGAAEQVIVHPQHPYTQSLLASVPTLP